MFIFPNRDPIIRENITLHIKKKHWESQGEALCTVTLNYNDHCNHSKGIRKSSSQSLQINTWELGGYHSGNGNISWLNYSRCWEPLMRRSMLTNLFFNSLNINKLTLLFLLYSLFFPVSLHVNKSLTR